jgi:hypothetical protein
MLHRDVVDLRTFLAAIDGFPLIVSTLGFGIPAGLVGGIQWRVASPG